jgi:hypothetical protein
LLTCCSFRVESPRKLTSCFPSEYPEVQSYPHLHRLLADHIDIQFEDLRLLLKQPRGRSTVGANFATAALLFNVISGASVSFYKASWAKFTAKTGSESGRAADQLAKQLGF